MAMLPIPSPDDPLPTFCWVSVIDADETELSPRVWTRLEKWEKDGVKGVYFPPVDIQGHTHPKGVPRFRAWSTETGPDWHFDVLNVNQGPNKERPLNAN